MRDREQPTRFWSQVEATCETLHSDVYLPSDIEAHLHNAGSSDDAKQSYNSQLRASLHSVEHIFHPEGHAYQAENAFKTLDSELEIVENKLLSLISSLEMSAATLQKSADYRKQLICNATITADEGRYISEFAETLVLPEATQTAVKSSNPHSEDFKHALDALSRALVSCDLHKDTPAVQQISRSIISLRDVAIHRIEERFRESFQLMRDPTSSFMILRDTLLLKQRSLVDFLGSHGRASFEYFTKEYVQVAKLAFDVHVRSHCSLLVQCGSSSDALTRNFASIGDRTSKMLSSIWDFASTASNTSDIRGQSRRPEIPESSQDENRRKEDGMQLADQCADAMRTSLSPPLTDTEIQLKENSLRFPLNRLIRELIASFLSYEKSESQFLEALLNGDGHVFLRDIFSDVDNPVLSCIEDCILNTDSTSEPEELCLSLYVCRRIREGITTHQEVDHRVTMFVFLERVIQTRFRLALDSRAEVARELLFQQGGEDVELRSVPEITRFSALVTNLLIIAQQGDKWVQSRDVGYALMRRLYSCINTLLSTSETIESSIQSTDYEMKAYLRCTRSLLIALDICQSLDPHNHGTEDLRKLVEESFCRGCKAYAKSFEDHSLKEIGELESSASTLSTDEAVVQVSVLLDKLSQAQSMVRKGLKFLADDNVDDVYESEAVMVVLKSLHQRTEALKRSLSPRHVELSRKLHW